MECLLKKQFYTALDHNYKHDLKLTVTKCQMWAKIGVGKYVAQQFVILILMPENAMTFIPKYVNIKSFI